MDKQPHRDPAANDPVIALLNRIIRTDARALPVIMALAIMALVILWGVADVLYVLWPRLMVPPLVLLEINDILATFGAFMTVLIAIGIYHNVILCVHDEHSHHLAVEIVLSTALMPIARKVIVFDFKEVGPKHSYGTAAVSLALAIGYYLIALHGRIRRAAPHANPPHDAP